MDRRRQSLYNQQKHLQEKKRQIFILLDMTRQEIHKMQVERMHWESMNSPMPEISANEESNASTLHNQLLNEAEVNAQAVNFEVSELFKRTNGGFSLDDKEEEEEEEEEEIEEEPEDPDTENELSEDDVFSMF